MSHAICKSIKIIPAPEDPAKWCAKIVGHANNVRPYRDEEWIPCMRFSGWAEAAGDILYACIDGEIQGSNRFTVFADELRLKVVESKAFERFKVISAWYSRIHDFELAYDSRFIKKEDVEKSEAKAARAAQLRRRANNRMKELCADLARQMLRWKPDKSRYHVRVGAGYWVKSRGAHSFKYTSDKHDAKSFSRIAAEEFKSRFQAYNPELIEA